MKIICAPKDYEFPIQANNLNVELYGQSGQPERGSAGTMISKEILKQGLIATPRAWDFLTLALSVMAADLAGHRRSSPDGWTRDFNLSVAVTDPDFWNSQRKTLEAALAFLTTDRWSIQFLEGGFTQNLPINPQLPNEDCVVLLSGGLDSLIGTIDLAAAGKTPFAVSHIVRGDAEKQKSFAQQINNGLKHLQLNHNARVPNPEQPPSQRSRSIIFLAYGILAATTLSQYQEGDIITLYVCENGFISVNPPLTGARIGSLSTRTTHPVFLNRIQAILDAADLRVRIVNPYACKTKGEMLIQCADQTLLAAIASTSTSCGRFKRFGYKHCGRCLPCQIRRSAFLTWGEPDKTDYVYTELGINDVEHAGFDDVRSAAMAIAEVQHEGIDSWLGTALSSRILGNVDSLKAVVGRGLNELAALHQKYGVQ
jgi:7-cyano-7-deazaguanine synthase in queuosine biosynthesis